MPTTVRFASTQEDREAIWRLRYRVYVEEMGYDFGSMPGGGRLPDMPSRSNRRRFSRKPV